MIHNVFFIPNRLSYWISAVLLAGSSLVYAQENHIHKSTQQLQSPDLEFRQLFNTVQKGKYFPDQKTFADAVPKSNPTVILAKWQNQKKKKNFNIKKFIEENFILPKDGHSYVTSTADSLRQHINGLWPILTRTAKPENKYDPLLPLPKPYIVPGGRFRECYYWDSYFTMLGLAESGHWDDVQNMIDNFSSEINSYGHIPNGNRSYYLSRSQPPFFSLMIKLLAKHKGNNIYKKYLPELKKEYKYWMEDSNKVPRGQAVKRVIKLNDGSLLNRYWDERNEPRTESWMDDITTAKKASSHDKKRIYRELRAGAASGWDFSSRWLKNKKNLASIRTTELIPIDLNSLLFHLEKTIAKAYKLSNQSANANYFESCAKKRQAAINYYLWNKKQGWYADYNWQVKKINNQLTAATVFPLYMKIANNKQAKYIALAVEKNLLKSGGLVTTMINSGQQWDAPNGWAPLQWIAVKGLENYNFNKLSQKIGQRFLNNVQQTYDKEHKIVEKYIVEGKNLKGGKGGEYPLQDGFGWTNGVTLMLLDKYCPKNKTCNNALDIPNMPLLNKN